MHLRFRTLFAVIFVGGCVTAGCSTLSDAIKPKNAALPAENPAPNEVGQFNIFRPATKASGAKPLSDAEYDAQMLQGKNLERVKKWDEARAVYQPLIAARPDRYEAYHRLAVVADRQQRYSEAEALYSQAIRLSPGNPELFNDLGYSFLLQNEFGKAEVAILKAVAIAPANERYRNNLGLACGFQGRYDEAMDQFRKGGNEADACCNMAFILAQRGEVALAEQYLRNALAQDPQHKAARRALESLYATPEQSDETLLSQGARRWEPYDSKQSHADPEDSRSDTEPSVVQASHSTPSSPAWRSPFSRPTAQSHLRSARSAWSSDIQDQAQ